VALIAQFGSQSNSVGWALLLGIAAEGDLMMIIAESLGALLRLDARSVDCYLSIIRWRSAGPADITRQQIRDTFGMRLLTAALRFNLQIHYRIRRDSEPTEYSNTLDDALPSPPEISPPPVFNPEVLLAADDT
jgi:hypothetical protein